MSNSKEYIKMCEKADEVQSLGFMHRWNYWYDKKNAVVKLQSGQQNEDRSDKTYSDCINAIWLPRQDQLQAMMKEAGNCPMYVLGDFMDYYRKEHPTWVSSISQLWLSFVMESKFNKTWNGKDWI